MHRELCDFALELVHNAYEAGADRVQLAFVQDAVGLVLDVRDNGRGMTAAQIAAARDPFATDGLKHPGRKVGLGLAFLAQSLEDTGGTLVLDSAPGRGTSVRAVFNLLHVDTAPVGNVVEMFRMLLAGPWRGELEIERKLDGRGYALSRNELLEAMGDLEQAESLELLRVFLQSQEDEVQGPNLERVKESQNGKDDT